MSPLLKLCISIVVLISSIYVSSNGGTTFSKTAALGSSTAVNQIRVHPAVAGDIWATTDTGLFHSVDFGKTFSQSAGGVTTGYGFGKFVLPL